MEKKLWLQLKSQKKIIMEKGLENVQQASLACNKAM